MAIATRGGRRHLMTVEKHDHIGRLMDWQALAWDAVLSNGTALDVALRGIEAGPIRAEIQRACHYTHERLSELLNELREQAGIYDGPREAA